MQKQSSGTLWQMDELHLASVKSRYCSALDFESPASVCDVQKVLTITVCMAVSVNDQFIKLVTAMVHCVLSSCNVIMVDSSSALVCPADPVQARLLRWLMP